MTPYLIYSNTLFLRKLDGGFEFVEDYTGVVRTDHQLPDLDVIRDAIKRAGKPFKNKRERFVLIDWGDHLEAVPDWGVLCGNFYNREASDEEIETILSQPNVEAIVFVTDDEVSYVTRQESET